MPIKAPSALATHRPMLRSTTAGIAFAFAAAVLSAPPASAQDTTTAPAPSAVTTTQPRVLPPAPNAPEPAAAPQAQPQSQLQGQAPAPAQVETQPAVTPPAPTASGEPATPAQPLTTGDGGAAVQPLAQETAVPDEAQPAAGEPADLLTQFLTPQPRSDIPHDLSPVGMFLAADWVVKSVMIGLALASLITWTVWLAKTLELAGARRRAKSVIKVIRRSKNLTEAVTATARRGGPAASMLREAARELELSEGALDHAENAGVKERVSSILGRIEAYAGRRMMRGTGALATIGSVGPFVGLFGTVWGIMNSFIGISKSQTTNLAVVAPGIAEALLATAIGLVAAIPAVVIYNMFSRSITGYRQLLADAAAGVERLVSRDLDFRKVPPGQRKAPVSLVAGE
ncbi:tonB-system energizer ExbB [Rhizobium sp. SL86]|uniref:tonB-system energizer ExbB n=1 Tax=Rhizobium sp. SL86 TaxID=2995148 RepID=UPI00227383BB|nr:tonB-system energizer ExbB [Rhizobium sp. SL86]MCY1665226.1 tonB-system energizer ExbB [Rhizobium sp. SL86]